MPQIILSEFVLLTTTFSGVFLFISYSLLLHTDKAVPPEMLATTQVIVAGSVAGFIAKTCQKQTSCYTKESLADYALKSVAVTQVLLSVNYVVLIWLQRQIPKEFLPAIGSLAITILTLTNFRGSSSNKSLE